MSKQMNTRKKEEDNHMRKKLKPDLDLESVQSDLIEMVCSDYTNGTSVRALAKQYEISPMKTRKILITGGAYNTDLSEEIGELWRDGKTVTEIADLLNTTKANINSYLPYERIIYNMEERSVEADRQARYRERKKSGESGQMKEPNKPIEITRIRTKTMIIVIGAKLRKLIPEGVLDRTTDPLARDQSYTWGTNVNGRFELHEPEDPDKNIWCAEITAAGRGKNKKIGVVLESANSGFAVMSRFPEPPVINRLTDEELQEMNYAERRAVEEDRECKLKEYRAELEEVFLEAIKTGLLEFCMPKERVLDYIDTVARVELMKGKRSVPGIRLEELIKQELHWGNSDDPVKQFNIRGNWTTRKYGNSVEYRDVDSGVQKMLKMTADESRQWLEDFLLPLREKMKNSGDEL